MLASVFAGKMFRLCLHFCVFFLMFGGVSFPHQSDLSLRQLTHECCGSHLHTLVMGRRKSPNGLGKWSHACRRTLWIVHCYVGLLGSDIFLPVSWTHIEAQEFLVLLWSNRFTSPSITLFKPIPTSQRQRLPVGFQYIQNINGMAHLRSLHHLGVLCQRPTAPAVYLKPCESWWNVGPTNLHRTFTPSKWQYSTFIIPTGSYQPPWTSMPAKKKQEATWSFGEVRTQPFGPDVGNGNSNYLTSHKGVQKELGFPCFVHHVNTWSGSKNRSTTLPTETAQRNQRPRSGTCPAKRSNGNQIESTPWIIAVSWHVWTSIFF